MSSGVDADDGTFSDMQVDGERLAAVLAEASVLVVVGPGGVGKTTLSAALAAKAAADHDRRALVVTVDPARRLAQAMGVADLTEEPVRIPTGGHAGKLWALMVDMSKSWDELVHRHAPDDTTRDSLLGNRLYQALTRRFAQSHDYIALDHLVDLVDDDRFDLVVVDTPPSVHAIDILDAPDRMIEFFGSRLLRWLTAPYRSRVVNATAKPFLSIAERLLGGEFLAEVTEFFWRFSTLQPDFVRRANLVKARMANPSTRYVVVRTLEEGPASQAAMLGDELARRGHEASLWISNRVLDYELQSSELQSSEQQSSEQQSSEPHSLETQPTSRSMHNSPTLAEAIEEVADQAANQQMVRARFALDAESEVLVRWQPNTVADIDELRRLLH